jgi:hypothetical protein
MTWDDEDRFNDQGIYVPEPSGRVGHDIYYGERDEVSESLGGGLYFGSGSIKKDKLEYDEDSLACRENLIDVEDLLWSMSVPEGQKCIRIERDGEKVVPIFAEMKKVPPKPAALIGCSEPALRKDGFWSCKREKDGSSYTWIYTEDLTHNFFEQCVTVGVGQESAKNGIIQAINHKPEGKGFWVTTFEPTFSQKTETLQSVKNANPSFALDGTNLDWEELAKNFDLENESNLLSESGYFLILARWIKDGIATWSDIGDDSSKIGNYRNHHFPIQIELTGYRYFGGLFGFVGNTFKVLKITEKESKIPFLTIGGHYDCNGRTFNATQEYSWSRECNVRVRHTGWIELSKK